MMKKHLILLLISILLNSNVSLALATEDPVFLDVDQAFNVTTKKDGNVLAIQFEIAPGYYLYKQKLKIAPKNLTSFDVLLPPGKTHYDEFFGTQMVYRDTLNFRLVLTETSNESLLLLSYQGCADEGLCYPPQNKTILMSRLTPMPFPDNAKASSAVDKAMQVTVEPNKESTTSEQYELESILAGDSFLWSILMFFAIGIGLSFTPCVFPMYPILTGLIVAQGDGLKTKKAFMLSFFYVQGMAVTYTVLGVVVALAGLQFQAAFQHPIVLISLSILFVFLALSMFDVFNLALPSRWQTKLSQLSNSQRGGSYIGVLVMGIISGLVASPCTTAPLTAALLYIAQSGDVMLGASALYALSLGMGLPLIVLGTSGGKLLPKAGSWMNIVKNIFGFLLLAVPVFLLERMLPEFVSNLIWVALLLGFSTYLHVSNTKGKSEFWYGVRSLIIFVMLFVGSQQAYQQIFAKPIDQTNETTIRKFKNIGNLDELLVQIERANLEGKTVLVDLYADWCVACKEFEKYTFYEKMSQQALKNTVLMQIDLTDTSSRTSVKMMNYFKVLGLPTIMLFDINGKELKTARITGFMGAVNFATHINRNL